MVLCLAGGLGETDFTRGVLIASFLGEKLRESQGVTGESFLDRTHSLFTQTNVTQHVCNALRAACAVCRRGGGMLVAVLFSTMHERK